MVNCCFWYTLNSYRTSKARTSCLFLSTLFVFHFIDIQYFRSQANNRPLELVFVRKQRKQKLKLKILLFFYSRCRSSNNSIRWSQWYNYQRTTYHSTVWKKCRTLKIHCIFHTKPPWAYLSTKSIYTSKYSFVV